jgi:hypothetical protein
MAGKIGILIVLTLFCFQLNSCASLSDRAKMKTGMSGGCISGAAIGAAVGSVPGAMLGGMLGTAIGTFLDEYYERKSPDREEELSKRKLKDGEQKLVIKDISIDPNQVSSGAQATSHVQYSVPEAAGNGTMEIKETRMLNTKKEGTVQLSEITIERSQGIHNSSLAVKIPEGISKGDAVLITTISYRDQKATAQTTLKIL